MTASPPRLEADSVSFAYEPDIAAVKGIRLSLPPGSRVALIGQNGSGKTTFAKILAGLLSPQHGRVLLDGNSVGELPPGRRARAIGFVFQNPDHQIFSPTVRDELAFGPRNLGCSDSEVDSRVTEAVDRFHLGDYLDQPPAILSFGLRRKVTIAAVYTMQTPILLLDEPTTGLDPRAADELLSTLILEGRAEKTVLFISHDMGAVAQYAEQCVLLREGTVVADRPTHRLLADEELLGANGLQAPPIVRLKNRLGSGRFDSATLTVEAVAQELRQLIGQPSP